MGNAPVQPPQPAFCEHGDRPAQVGLQVVQRYLMPAFFLLVLTLGLPLNLLSLWVFSRRLKTPWRRSTVLLFSLTLADTSWLLALPFLVAFHLDGLDWRLGRPLCRAVRVLYHNYFYLSIVFVAVVSVDRYVAIVHPLRSLALLGRPRLACLLCAVVWGVTLLLSVPVAGMSETQRCPGTNRTVCTLYMMMQDTRENLPYSLFSSVTGFLLPLASICYCYCRSVRELRRRGARLPRPPHPGRMRRLTRVLTAVLILFTALYLPYHLVRNATIMMRTLYPLDPGGPAVDPWGPVDLAFIVMMCMCSLNTVINPLFTCLVGRQVRREFRGVLAALCRLRCCGGAALVVVEPVVTAAPLRAKRQGAGHHGVNAVTPL